jgi:DNA-binding NarL/FixJ family response regulator
MEPTNEQPTVLFVGNDLMFQSKISSACKQAGVTLKVLRNAQAFSPESLGESLPKMIIVDLGLASLDLAGLLPRVREVSPQSKWLGYGSHVFADQLDAASELGLDTVMTRGQFDRDMVRVLQSITL